ncbi:unnamed protein product [Somion occarium]|uniref:NAD-dependent epimerase/dehydratase domain-containing protein n=1 Tax=Somion occarium TaxID=3059160 RepID=A0ABP1D8T1_9APHY
MSTKPNAIIFGGLNTCSRALAAFLVPLEGEPLVANLRIVDKYTVQPPTTYLGSEFPRILEKPNVEYRQVNLCLPEAVPACFDPAEGQEPYSYVFDLTGDINWERNHQIQIANTFNVARHVGLEAARRRVKAYVRLQHPFYECKEKGPADEKEDIKPDGTIGTWWHETLRMLASIEDLNLVILRTAMVYGPYVDGGNIIRLIAVAATYGYLHKPMKGLWSPGKYPSHTVHIEDIAGAMFAVANWIAGIGRKEADSVAGEEIVFHNDKAQLEAVEGAAPPEKRCVAPLFNLEDDSNVTMVELCNIITSYFGTTFEFVGFVKDTFAKFKLEDVVEDINGEHVATWTEMIMKSDPPVTNLTYTAYMDLFHLKKHSTAFTADKIKRVVGYKLRRPQINHETIKEIIDGLKAEGTWPNV